MKIIKIVILVFTLFSIALALETAAMLKEDDTVDTPGVVCVSVDEFARSAYNYPQIVNNLVNDVHNSTHTDKELEILAIIIYQEAGGDKCSDDTRRKVGSVFLNRVACPLFPNDFEAVATAHRQYGTLYITGIKWPDRATNPGEAHAVKRAYRIAEELLVSGSILPDNVIWQAEFIQGDGIYCEQDEFYFCYSEVIK